MLAFIWWAGFAVVAIWMQSFVPGVDFLAPSILFCLQREKNTQALWMAVIWVLIEEGCGTLPFGYAIISYLLIYALYRCGIMFFDVQSFMFTVLCGVAIGVMHPVLIGIIAMLADLSGAADRYVAEGILQGLFFPVVWLLIKLFYPERLKNEPPV
ncbi:hypothetical protein [Maridesulfovibrio bastinii]|uniref:hypothetical protein n=1 Tax=Maridesulfovibrio bastinii TaxID=47157 RepID=UPI00040C3C63|nr:hypothetical protein [Maridesulfovibrio bastinii]